MDKDQTRAVENTSHPALFFAGILLPKSDLVGDLIWARYFMYCFGLLVSVLAFPHFM